jgi:hypothetical protein
VILHNVIIENERKHPVPEAELLQTYHRQGPLAELDGQVPTSWTSFLAMRQEIRNSRVHQELQNDPVSTTYGLARVQQELVHHDLLCCFHVVFVKLFSLLK